MVKDSSSILTEVKAKIIWGESTSSVKEFLLSKGVTEAEADAKIEEFNQERYAAIRGNAIGSIITGTVLLAVAGIFFTGSHNTRRPF